MPASVSRIAKALLVAPLLLAPPAAHFALLEHRGSALAGILVAVQAVIVAWIGSAPLHRPVLRAIVSGVVFLLVLALWRFAGDGPVVASAVPHAMAYTALLACFLASLAPGREAVITKLALRSRGHLPSKVELYTRRVTWVWCGFFAAQLLGSLVLLIVAPLNVWSLFINLCNLPLIAIFLGVEYWYRQRYHAAQPPERLIDMIRVFRGFRNDLVHDDR